MTCRRLFIFSFVFYHSSWMRAYRELKGYFLLCFFCLIVAVERRESITNLILDLPDLFVTHLETNDEAHKRICVSFSIYINLVLIVFPFPRP